MGLVVVSEDVDLLSSSHCNLCDIRNKVVGDSLRILPYSSRGMSTNWVEVAKKHYLPVIVGGVNVGENLLYHALCPAVGVCASSLGGILGYRDFLGRAVNGCGRAENDVFDIVRAHYLQKIQSAADVVFIVFNRLLDGFSNGFQTRKVDKRSNIRIFIKDSLDRLFVHHIGFIKFNLFAGKLFNTAN